MNDRPSPLRRAAAQALLVLVAALTLAGCTDSSAAPGPQTVLIPAAESGAATVEELLAQPMERLIAYDLGIQLTAAQEEIRRAALTPIPAPCCSDRTALTCCCPCNLARSWWGLSKVLITEFGQEAAGVQANVERFIHDLRPQGFAGDSCYTGRCTTAAKHDGCSGMDPNNVIGG